MPFNMLMFTCAIVALPEPTVNPSVADPILLAHRGLVEHAPENTLPAFATANVQFSISPKPLPVLLAETPMQNRVPQIIHCPQSLSHQPL